jgi:PKD repeat protein
VGPTHVYTAAASYTVTLCVTDDDGAASCCATTARIVEEGGEACPRSQGFWKQQCAQRDNGSTKVCQEGMEYLWRMIIDDTGVEEWRVEGETFETTAELRALPDAMLAVRLCAQLVGPRPMTLLDDVERQYLALELNVWSGALPPATPVDLPGVFTGLVVDALGEIEAALNTGNDLERAAYIADRINNGYGLEAPPCPDPNAIFAAIPGCDGDQGLFGDAAAAALADAAHGGAAIPVAFTVDVHPNPTRQRSSSIDFTVTGEMGPSAVEIAVYDVGGRLVRTIRAGVRNPGHHSLTWDLTDARGARVSTGLYFFRIAVGDEVRTLKQLVIHN